MERRYNFNFEAMHAHLNRYCKSGDIKDFKLFVKSGAGRFILLVARSKFRGIKKDRVKVLAQETANVVLHRLMRLSETSIKDIKNYLYMATIYACYAIIKKYKLYENENLVSRKEKEYEMEHPKHTPNGSKMMNMYYENLLYYLTQQMEPEPMKPYQAYVFLEFIKGHSCERLPNICPTGNLRPSDLIFEMPVGC